MDLQSVSIDGKNVFNDDVENSLENGYWQIFTIWLWLQL